MKANRRTSPHIALVLAALAPLFAAVACSDRQIIARPPASTTQAATQAAIVRPAPPPALRPDSRQDWRDAAITPGNWRWGMEGSRSVARFGGDALVLSCNRDAAAVTLIRPGSAAGEVPITIVTSAGARPLSAVAQAGPPPVIAVTIPARDTVLDAMAFSRGRFAVETAGLPTLYVPSWPEVSRVVEDCR